MREELLQGLAEAAGFLSIFGIVVLATLVAGVISDFFLHFKRRNKR